MAAVLALLARGAGLNASLAGRAAGVLGTTSLSASISTSADGAETIWSGDTTSLALQDLGFTLGEGPSVDAARRGVLVLAPEVGTSPARWPVFAIAAHDLGVRALFAFPLRMGAIGLGVLEVYRDAPGPLGAVELIDGLVLADAVTARLLRLSADAGAVDLRAAVHQATGMIAVQLETGLAEALARLRAHAFGSGRPINDVAADVVAGRLNFTEHR
ncbi:ANTAR domain-containing protein [Streptomyces sp. B6B3]|uniref:ANTAR domain-containing protein n=1 Tax=Streptomyces sp. B6B3 TaxID=3153570 RepID=UPI00325DACC4